MIKLEVRRLSVMIALVVVFTLLLAACGGAAAPTAQPAPTATEEPAAAPAEEEAAEPEAEATEEPVEEATEEPVEEATAEPEEEATAEPEEEATAEPEEEATAEPEEEATAEPEEEATAEPEEESTGSAMSDAVAAGAYIRTMAGGCGCHFNRDLGALAGGNGFMDDMVFSRNLTPDETGIANLTDEELASLIRFGHYEDRVLVVMPNFSTMADEDVMNLITYLRSLDPVENEIADRTLDFEPVANEYPDPPAVAPTEGAARGGYVASIVRCGRCHTPTDDDGNPLEGMLLAGAPYQDTVAPNLTPDEETGLAAWTEEEIADFLATGVYSDGTEAHAGMKGTVDNITSKLTEEDRQAIAAALKTLPPVSNEPSAE